MADQDWKQIALDYLVQTFDVLRVIVVSLVMCLYHAVIALLPYSVLPKKSVANNVVLITGAGSGIGRLVAVKLARLGARLVLWDVNEDGNKKTANIIKAAAGEAYPFTCDISDREAIYKTAELVKKQVGDVDILINNAGIVTGKNLLECPDHMIVKTFEVNTLAHFWTTKSFLPKMIERQSGHIVTISSAAGVIAVNGLSDYCASKYGAVGFHESLGIELDTLGHKNVHNTLVCPYYINTGMFDGVKTRFPSVLPILDPEFVSEKIVNAILTNQKMVGIPRMMYLFFFLKGFLPIKVAYDIGHYMGVTCSMDDFKGRPKK